VTWTVDGQSGSWTFTLAGAGATTQRFERSFPMNAIGYGLMIKLETSSCLEVSGLEVDFAKRRAR
jgi:hypothetical protein